MSNTTKIQVLFRSENTNLWCQKWVVLDSKLGQLLCFENQSDLKAEKVFSLSSGKFNFIINLDSESNIYVLTISSDILQTCQFKSCKNKESFELFEQVVNQLCVSI